MDMGGRRGRTGMDFGNPKPTFSSLSNSVLSPLLCMYIGYILFVSLASAGPKWITARTASDVEFRGG